MIVQILSIAIPQFSGRLYGNGHAIIGLYINRPTQDNVGLFGEYNPPSIRSAIIDNIRIVDAVITGRDNTGSLVGIITGDSITISNITLENTTVTGIEKVGGVVGIVDSFSPDISFDSINAQVSVTGSTIIGGLAGQVSNSSITQTSIVGTVTGISDPVGVTGGLVGVLSNNASISLSQANANVTGVNNVGGFVGANLGQIEQSSSQGTVSGTSNVGGFAAGIIGGGSVTDSYTLSNVSGTENVGGLAGFIASTGPGVPPGGGSVTRAYASGTLSGTTNVGGFLGTTDGTAIITDSYWNTETSGHATTAGDAVGKTTAQLTDINTYVGWDIEFVDKGGFINNGFPYINDGSALWGITDSFTSGSGTEEDPYIVTTCRQLQLINSDLAAHYRLGSNIDCSETATWNPNEDEWVDGVVGGELIPDEYEGVINNGYRGFESIGRKDYNTPGIGFTGSFDGNDYTISNLWIFSKDEPANGLFGAATGATIKNVRILNANIVGGDSTGGILGFGSNVVIDNVINESGMVRAYLSSAGGGFAGFIDNSTITNSFASGTVTGLSVVIDNDGEITIETQSDDIGGFVGFSNNSDFANSYATGDVTSIYGVSIGGFVGSSLCESTFIDSYATGNVTGASNVGGFSGFDGCEGPGSTFTDSYAIGNITGGTGGGAVGGFIGYAEQSTVIRSYATGNVINNSEDIDKLPYNFAGFIGSAANGSIISASYATGNVEGGLGNNIAGFIGYMDGEGSSITNSYATGNVSGNNFVGGFLGRIGFGEVEAVYASGSVNASGIVLPIIDEETNETESLNVSGLVNIKTKFPENVTIQNSFWDVQTSGQATSDGGTGKTTTEMKTLSTFTNVGWDFEDIWAIQNSNNNGYPYFTWQTFDNEESPEPEPTPTRRRSSGGGSASPAFLAQLGITLANPGAPTTTPSLGEPGLCSADQLLTQNLRAPSRNGVFNSYTQGIVREINILQGHLNRLGFNSGPIDGIAGPLTDGAIKRMQVFLGTTPDGFVGPITRGLLNNSCGSN